MQWRLNCTRLLETTNIELFNKMASVDADHRSHLFVLNRYRCVLHGKISLKFGLLTDVMAYTVSFAKISLLLSVRPRLRQNKLFMNL